MRLGLGQMDSCHNIITSLASRGKVLKRHASDRSDMSIDTRSLELLLDVSGDPEVGLGNFAQGVRIRVAARLPRLPAHYKRKKKWRSPSQSDPQDYLENHAGSEGSWRNNFASINELADKVEEVMEDQAKQGQVIKLSSCRMVHEVHKRSHEQPGREHGHLRRRTGQDNVRGGGIGIRKTIPGSPPTRKLPSHVTFILWHQSNQVERERH